VMAFAYTLPAIFIAISLTGNFIPQLGYIGDTTEGVSLLEKINTINTSLGFSEFTEGTKDNKLNMFCITAALMFGTAGLPHVIVRFFTVKDVKAVRKSACWTLAFIAVIYLTAPAVGVFSRINMIEALDGKKVDKEQFTNDTVPEWYFRFEKTKSFKWDDKNGDGRIQYRGAGESKDGLANELTVKNDIMVMANPYMGNAPKWVVGLLMAGCIAAALSTAAGLLLVLSTAISHDLMKNINPPGFVAQTVAFAFGLAAASFFPTLLMGIFSKRVNMQGGIAGMAAGITFTLAYIIYYEFWPHEIKPDYWLGISSAGIGLIGMLINFAVTFIVSAITPAPPQEVQNMVESIRMPDHPDDESATNPPVMH